MYKNANKSQQFAASHLSLAEMERGEAAISIEDQRQALVDRYNKLNDQIRHMEKTPERKAICLELGKIAGMLRDMGSKERRVRVLEQHFVDAAKEMLTPAMFKIVMKEAVKRQEAANEPA